MRVSAVAWIALAVTVLMAQPVGAHWLYLAGTPPQADAKAKVYCEADYHDGPIHAKAEQIVYFKGEGSDYDYEQYHGGTPKDGVTYLWNFGDGTTSTLQNPMKAFLPGTYTVTLTVNDVGSYYDDSQKAQDTVGVEAVAEVRVDITSPTYPNNKFAFNWASPGVCDIACTATSNPSDYQPCIAWYIVPITGSTTSYTPPKGPSITIRYTTLPSANAQFGEKTMSASAAGGVDIQAASIFFALLGTNHPSTGVPSEQEPFNWYYYWDQTTASFGTHHFDWNYQVSSYGETYWDTEEEPPKWRSRIGPSSYGPATYGSETHYPGEESDGIDTFARVCRHEQKHLDIMPVWWPGGPGTEIDHDQGVGDGVPDLVELMEEELGYSPLLVDSDGAGFRDSEDYACDREVWWNLGAGDSQDWASPGHQW